MSIYISGLEMPVFEHQSWDIRKGADGKWYMVDTNAETSDGEWHEIVPVPPHGDLIDRNALPWEKQGLLEADEDWALPCSIIENAPAVISAEEVNAK